MTKDVPAIGFNDNMFDVDIKALDAELNTGNVLYLSKQTEKVLLRIVYQPNTDKQYFIQYETDYQGKPVKQVAFKAVRIVGSEQYPMYVVGKPTHLKEINRILQAIKEDNGILGLHPQKGTILTFTKSGEGLQTKYHVSPTLRVVDVMEHYQNGFDVSLEEFVDKQTKPAHRNEPTPFDIEEDELFSD
jgi:hypothetical protein